MEINPKLVGIRIMQKRKEKKWSQEKLAEMIDISKNHLSSIECGVNLPTVKVTQNICNALGGTFDYYYLGRINEETKEKIIKSFQKLSENEQKVALELINFYVQHGHKFD